MPPTVRPRRNGRDMPPDAHANAPAFPPHVPHRNQPPQPGARGLSVLLPYGESPKPARQSRPALRTALRAPGRSSPAPKPTGSKPDPVPAPPRRTRFAPRATDAAPPQPAPWPHADVPAPPRTKPSVARGRLPPASSAPQAQTQAPLYPPQCGVRRPARFPYPKRRCAAARPDVPMPHATTKAARSSGRAQPSNPARARPVRAARRQASAPDRRTARESPPARCGS